ncbi:hypothetical protein M2138_001762 [Dysgonomonadaceae bacterium PH5-43]|nr:hypothetical protein [Dysgonomonadaceae bacterium PH5-43]
MRKIIIAIIAVAFSLVSSATPIDNLLNRIGGAGTSDRILTAIEASTDGKEYFTITSKDGKPKIIGDSYLSVATGINWYLKYNANVLLTWNNLTTDLSEVSLPVPETSETRSTNLKYRYYLNYCTYSYSMAFWDWERWEKEIDFMALHGINMPLALTGTEVVWRNVLINKLGYSKDEANKFIAGPAFQAWFLMNNLEGWGGANPDAWYDQQEALQKKIVARMRELNIEPVLAGYSGMVPHDINSKKGWSISNPGTWCYFQRPGFLLPTDANFNEMAKYYYDEMAELYGTSAYYSMDPFHEGGNTTGVNLDAAFKAVYNAMKNYSGNEETPQWVIQSWQENPRQEALNALEPGTLIVLDLFSDAVKKWGSSYAQSSGKKHEFVYCMLNNFGGRTGLHGRLDKTVSGFYDAKTQFPQTMLGVGATPEGIENNPMLYEALFELPWRETKVESEDWIKSYANIRYGKKNEAAEQAWSFLLNSVYACPTSQQGVSEAIICARPSLTVNSVSTWSTSNIYWEVDDVKKAAQLLLSQSESLSGKNFEYDVVDVVRQALSDYSYTLLTRINDANTAKDKEKFKALSNRFLELILNQDELLNTIPDFMLGKWINDARNLGKTKEEKDIYEKNARLLVTTWGPQASANSGGLKDYSNREWGGLLKDYYYPRWELMFNKLKAGNSAPSSSSYFNMEYTWATTPTTDNPYPYTSQNNPIETAKKIFEKYYMDINIKGSKAESFLAPVEGALSITDKQVVVYKGKTLEISFPAQGATKLFVDINANGTYESNEIFSATVKNGIASFTINEFANANVGETVLSLITDIEESSIEIGKEPVCGLSFSVPLVIMDEITEAREVSIEIAPEQNAYGSISIKGSDKLSVTNTEVVIVEAKSNIGYAFSKWTNAEGETISTDASFTYYGKDPIKLIAYFEEKGTVYNMATGQQSVTFAPALSTKEKWTIDAETIVFGDSFNQWGSTIIANGTNPFDGYTFQYYLRVDNEIKLNNSSTVATVVPDTEKGTTLRAVLTSDGSGKITTQLFVDGKGCETYSYTMASLGSICKATPYTMKVAVTLNKENSINEPQANNIYNIYGIDNRIIVENLKPEDNVSLYSIDGRKIGSLNTRLSSGTYIIVINGKSYKVSI